MPVIDRIRRLVSGVGALATIAALLIGVPFFLVRSVGWPLPSRLPSWEQFTSALMHTEIPLSVLTKTLACLGWLAWLLIAVSITTELFAWIGGTHTRELRFAGPFQHVARTLITSASVLFAINALTAPALVGAGASTASLAFETTASSLISTSHPAVLHPPVVDHRIERATTPTIATRTADSHAVEATVKQQTVQRHDTLWDLAERHLGDPYRWNEIWELNRGLVQVDETVFTDAHWIRPGWVLAMPPDAIGVTTVVLTPSAPEAPAPDSAPSTEVPSTEASEPSVSSTSLVTTAPATTTVAPSTVPEATTTAFDPEPLPTDSRFNSGTSVGTGSESPIQGTAFPARVPWVAGGLCAAGLVALLDRLRRAQRKRRVPGDPIHNPPAELAPIETGLRRSATRTEDRCLLLDAALRAFAAGAFGDPSMRTPRLLAVRSYPDSVELLLDEPLEGSVLGFTAQSGSRLWMTEPGMTVDLLLRLADEVAAPYPALVTIGEVDGGDLLVDIETAGSLAIVPDDRRDRDLFRRVAIELATSRWGEYFDVITVGEVPDFGGFERNRRFPSVGEALNALAATAREIDESLLHLGAHATVAPRVTFALGDGWIPSIFVTDQTLGAADAARLRSIVGEGGRGVGALVFGVTPAHWTVACRENHAYLAPLGIELIPLTMPADHAAAVEDLLADAAVGHLTTEGLTTPDPTRPPIPEQPPEPVDIATAIEQQVNEDVAPMAPPASPEQITLDVHDEIAKPAEPPLVRVLGAVGIDNINHEGRRKVIELIVYLALHPDGVSADRLTEALWPDAAPDPRTLTRNVCYARKALGLDREGNNHLPRINAAGRYRLGPHVQCDLLELIRLAKDARQADDPNARADLLGAAMKLVRDKPFDGITDYEWAWTENWVAVAETEVADAAVLLAETLIANGQAEAARRWTLIGRRAAPDDARLERLQANWR